MPEERSPNYSTSNGIIPLLRFITSIALLSLLLASCAGEPTEQDVAYRELAVSTYESRVERMVSACPVSDRIMQELFTEWHELESKYGSNYSALTNSEKMSVLNDLEGILKKLERAAQNC